MTKKSLVILVALALLFAGAKKKDDKSKQNQEQAGQTSEKEKAKSGLAFVHIFSSEIKGVYLAKSTGEVMVHGDDWVEYYDSEGRQLWKKDGFKFVCGSGVSRDGQTVLFQTSDAPKVQQTTLDLKVHVADRSGNEAINQPNPYKYFTSTLSPKGSYIVFGDPLYKMIYAYDRNLTLQWERETYLWYIYFDPDEQFIYDSAGGMILNIQGKRVWELPSGAKFLSVSSGAEILLSQRFLSAKARNQIYLTSRTTAQEVILEGWCAGVSYDGSLTAYEDMDRKVHVYRTKELFDKMTGGADAKPIWTGDFYLAKQIQFAPDNSRLFIYGENSQQSGRAEIIDLSKLKQTWEKEWVNPPTFVSASEDTRTMVFASGASLEYYKPK
jgi:hypothetical protein